MTTTRLANFLPARALLALQASSLDANSTKIYMITDTKNNCEKIESNNKYIPTVSGWSGGNFSPPPPPPREKKGNSVRVSYRGGGPGIFPLQLDFPPLQDFEIQYDVIIIIMYTMDIVQ